MASTDASAGLTPTSKDSIQRNGSGRTQDVVGECECRRGRSHANTGDDNRGQGEAGRAEERAAGVPKILTEDIEVQARGIADGVTNGVDPERQDRERTCDIATPVGEDTTKLPAVFITERGGV
jgi:hypothetical protein